MYQPIAETYNIPTTEQFEGQDDGDMELRNGPWYLISNNVAFWQV